MITLRGPPQTGGKPCGAICLQPRSRPPETPSGPTHRFSGRVLTHACPPGLRPVLDGPQPIPAEVPRTTRTTVVVDDPGTDEVTTSALARHRRRSAPAAAISS